MKSKTALQRLLVGIAVLLIVGSPFLYSAIVVPLSPWEQAQVSMAMIALALLAAFSRFMRPLIIFLSCFASMRYFYWRVSSTINLDSRANAAVSLVLLLAEIYGLVILFLGYLQTIEVQVQKHTPHSPKAFPAVDIFIPTYNESIDIVRRTIIGAQTI